MGGEDPGPLGALKHLRVLGAEVQAVGVHHQGLLAVGQHHRAQGLRKASQPAADEAGAAAVQGRQQLGLPGAAAGLQIQDEEHRLGHRLGQDGVQLLLHGDLHQAHPAAQGRPGRHDAGPRHAVAAAHQQQLPLAALVALHIRPGQPPPGEALVQLEHPGLGLLRQGGRHPHLAHHRLPAVLLGGVGAVGRLLPGKGHRGLGPEGLPARPAGVALRPAGQVRGHPQAVLLVAQGQQLPGLPGQLPPEAEPEHAVHQGLRLADGPLRRLPVPGQL